MNLGGLGTFTAPLQAPAMGLKKSSPLGVEVGQALAAGTPAAGTFQIPMSQEATSAPAALTSLPTDKFLPELSGKLDQLVKSFLEEMQEKTGLGPNLLMMSLNHSMQKLPDVEAMLKTFTAEVTKGSQQKGISVSPAELRSDFRVFLKDLQSTLLKVAAESEKSSPASDSEQDKKFKFEVLTEGQARDKRTQALVEKVQKDFFGVQAARPSIEAPEELASKVSIDPRMSTFSSESQAPRLQTTDQFFQTRQKEDQLLGKLRQLTSPQKSAESALTTVPTLNTEHSKVSTKENGSDGLAFEESLLDQIAIAGPVAPVGEGMQSPKGGGEIPAASDSAFESALKAQIPEDAKVENLGEIIQRARMAATSGGGEMELDLKPEGLGRVQIKVSVEGDQVQVQMTAESKRVQELLKEGLQDLRTQLAVHKLHSDSLRVDGSAQAQDVDLSRRDAAQDQQQRSFAQGFMQQFREDRESARGGMTRFPDPEGPVSGRSTDVIRPLSSTPRTHDGRLSLIA